MKGSSLSKASLAARLDALIEQTHMTVRQFELACDIANGSVYAYKTRGSIAPKGAEKIINRFPLCSFDWLRFGAGAAPLWFAAPNDDAPGDYAAAVLRDIVAAKDREIVELRLEIATLKAELKRVRDEN